MTYSFTVYVTPVWENRAYVHKKDVHTPSYYSTYLNFCIRYKSSINCVNFPIVHHTSCKSLIDKLCLDTKLWNFKVHQSGQILCAHKPYFLMPDHI